MKSLLLLITSSLMVLVAPSPQREAKRETVVLMHGLNRTSHSMSKMSRELERDGYTVINCGYPSRKADIQTLTDKLFDDLAPRIRTAGKVHFVTHSMGGILLRTYLRDHTLNNLGRVVMLAPPNSGSPLADRLSLIRLYRWISGPAGRQLSTGSDSWPTRLPSADYEVGVIAGDRSVNPILSLMIPGADDGKVSVASTALPGMKDFLRLHVTHTFLMCNRQVIRQTTHFLEQGCFQKQVE